MIAHRIQALARIATPDAMKDARAFLQASGFVADSDFCGTFLHWQQDANAPIGELHGLFELAYQLHERRMEVPPVARSGCAGVLLLLVFQVLGKRRRADTDVSPAVLACTAIAWMAGLQATVSMKWIASFARLIDDLPTVSEVSKAVIHVTLRSALMARQVEVAELHNCASDPIVFENVQIRGLAVPASVLASIAARAGREAIGFL